LINFYLSKKENTENRRNKEMPRISHKIRSPFGIPRHFQSVFESFLDF